MIEINGKQVQRQPGVSQKVEQIYTKVLPPLRPEVPPRTLFSPFDTVLYKANFMLCQLQAVNFQTYRRSSTESWADCQFVRNTLSLIDQPSARVRAALTGTRLTKYYTAYGPANNNPFKHYYILNLLLFDLLAPLLTAETKLLTIGYELDELTQWAASIALVDTNGLSRFHMENGSANRSNHRVYSLFTLAQQWLSTDGVGTLLQRVVDQSRGNYNYIVDTSNTSEADIRTIMSICCSNGKFIAFSRPHLTLKLYSYNSFSDRLISHTLLENNTLKNFFPVPVTAL